MSPSSSSSKLKSKDKRAAGKEPLKSSVKPTNGSTCGGVPASGYNPLLGTFHTLETAPVSSVPLVHVNGRFRNIDDTDDPNGNSVSIGVEYDCVSNNGSWSGESEDPKDKASQGPSRQDTIPGVDSDKREKIRQKNEKKHQRQKERRAQELHDRCCGYLMSRKLEALAQQLVAMGFPAERATMALMLNEGRVEESVAWLFEGGEDTRENTNVDSNLKVDISQELAQIVEMETKFKCTKQEVERAVVACEGDLEQAAENLMKLQKQESQAVPPKPEEAGAAASQMSLTSKVQSKCTLSAGAMPIPQKPDDKDINYTNVAVTAGRPLVELGSKNIQLLKKVPPNSQVVAASSVEKRWAVGGLNHSVSYSSASLLQTVPPLSKTETVGNELKNLQLGSGREPVVMMQRKHVPSTNMSASSSLASHVGVVEPVIMNRNLNSFTCTRSFNGPSYGGYEQFQYPPQQQYASSSQHAVAMSHMSSSNGMWNRTVGSGLTLGPASSLGLFSGVSHHMDWNACEGTPQFDYTNIDWSLNPSPCSISSPSRSNGLWMGYGRSGNNGMRATTLNGGVGLNPDGVGVGLGGGLETAGGGSHEWTSPFEEKDLFSLPRQYVFSPSRRVTDFEKE